MAEVLAPGLELPGGLADVHADMGQHVAEAVRAVGGHVDALERFFDDRADGARLRPMSTSDGLRGKVTVCIDVSTGLGKERIFRPEVFFVVEMGDPALEGLPDIRV